MSNDEYARRFMGGESVLCLDKVKIPLWMHAALLSGGIAAAIATIGAGAPLLAPLVAAPSVLLWGLLTTIRVSVTESVVHIQYGIWGPEIALADVIDVKVIDYKAMRFGGWGIRYSLSGERAYSVPGRGGRAVEIRYRSGANERVVVVSSERPDALKLAIDRARGAAASATLELVERRSDEREVANEVAVEEASLR